MTEINFAELKYPEKFEAILNQLLDLKFGAIAIKPPHDRGRDSYVVCEDGKIKIYQYKYFLNAMKPAQRTNVEKSLKTALSHYTNCKEWFLCLPREITSGDEDFLKSLSEKYNVTVLPVGESKLKNWFTETKFPLDQYFDSHMHKNTARKIDNLIVELGKSKPIKFETLLAKFDKSKPVKFETINEIITQITKMDFQKKEFSETLPIDIKEKININKFSDTFDELLKKQMVGFSQIDVFLQSGVVTRKRIENMLICLKVIYLNYKHQFTSGDEIFYKILSDILPDNANEDQSAAAITLLCYFFHSCEVFENARSK